MTKKKIAAIIAVSFAVLIGGAFAYFCIEGGLFRYGNPAPYFKAISEISDDTPVVKVKTKNKKTTYIAKSLPKDNSSLKLLEEELGMPFWGQESSYLIFSDKQDIKIGEGKHVEIGYWMYQPGDWDEGYVVLTVLNEQK